MLQYRLPSDFMLGTATSSLQIEGGDKNNTWYNWSESGHTIDNSSSIRACDHWNRVAEDIEILKGLHVHTHRMSLEWSRIEPSAGSFSEEAIKHYRGEIQLLLENHIHPIITLHHFSEPIWFHDLGGWLKKENAELFIAYVRFVVMRLGDLVCDWVTFNEPNVYTKFGYLFGCFPPGKKSSKESFKVHTQLVKTHVIAYKMIHQIRCENSFIGETKVGAAIHIRIFEGETFWGKCLAKAVDYIFNELAMVGFTTGRVLLPICRRSNKRKENIYVDYIGINYYTRNVVEFIFDAAKYFHRFANDRALDKTDLGWDIYPEGIYHVCKKYYQRYQLPIYITENGISDKLDDRRPEFIKDHIAYLAKAIQEGVKIERYYYWTVMDNFEWLEGETTSFGLYHCDFMTQNRTARKSAELYADLCKNREITYP